MRVRLALAPLAVPDPSPVGGCNPADRLPFDHDRLPSPHQRKESRIRTLGMCSVSAPRRNGTFPARQWPWICPGIAKPPFISHGSATTKPDIYSSAWSSFGRTSFPTQRAAATRVAEPSRRAAKYLHYQRFALPVADAVQWYQAAAGGEIALPPDPERTLGGDRVQLDGGPFVAEPPWPHLVTSNDLVFAPDWMHGARTHFLFPKETHPRSVVEIIQADKNRDKLEEWLNFDVVESYPDYQGVLCMLAPDPVVRSIETTRVEGATAGAGETVAYKLVARQGQCVRWNPAGGRQRARPRTDGAACPPIRQRCDRGARVPRRGRQGRTDDYPSHARPAELARAPSTPEEYPYQNGKCLRTKRIEVPPRGRKSSGYTYEVAEVGLESEDVVGDIVEDPGVVSRLADAEHRRTLQRAANDYDQQWFYRTPSDAAHYVRQRIGRARETVLIVDPYFAGRELLAFGHAIRRPDVELRILTSAQGFRRGCDGRSTLAAAKQLMDVLDQTFNNYRVSPVIRVLASDPPPVHDRFLIR